MQTEISPTLEQTRHRHRSLTSHSPGTGTDTLDSFSLLSCLFPSHTLSCRSSCCPQAITIILLSFPHSTLVLLLLVLSGVEVPHGLDVRVFAVNAGSRPTWRQLDPDPVCTRTTAASPPNP